MSKEISIVVEYKANQRPADVTIEQLEEARRRAEKNLKGTKDVHKIDVGHNCKKCGITFNENGRAYCENCIPN